MAATLAWAGVLSLDEKRSDVGRSDGTPTGR